MGADAVVTGGVQSSVRTIADDSIETNLFDGEALSLSRVRGISAQRAYAARKVGNGTIPSHSPKGAGNSGSVVFTIQRIVPGPNANLDYGYQIGFSAFLRTVPRVYPPIFLQR